VTPRARKLLKHWDACGPELRARARDGRWYRESRRQARAMARRHVDSWPGGATVEGNG
jgi:hypothetical protein